jgi:hypothetical protein
MSALMPLVAALFCGAEPDAAKLPHFDKPVMFNTAEADAILKAMQVFPSDNAWNEDVSSRPVAGNSKRMIAGIGADKRFACNFDMSFIVVPANQKKIRVEFVGYPDESDKGPFPIPENAPIEGWPLNGKPLAAYQQEKSDEDRHLIVVDPVSKLLHEFYQARWTGAGWQVSCAATFDLSSNKLRPDGWTSSDAAGLPIFPAIVRFDECEAGIVNHAMRFTVRRTRHAYVYPATHFASRLTDEDLPRMGERFRLRADYDDSRFSPHVRAIVKGLKKYGMFVADNGGDWRLSVAPDDRIKGLDELRRLRGSDFEVIVPTGPSEGPRSK